MTEIKSRINQYLGINAHLHSTLQNDGTWAGFHTAHIVTITIALRHQLRDMGYTAEVEDSLQIREISEIRYPRADILIRDTKLERGERDLFPTTQAGEIALPISTLLDTEVDYYKAIGIYPLDSRSRKRGKPVAWLELLSPSNKPGNAHFKSYEEKRANLLLSGLVFVELDYLHQTPPTFPRLIMEVANGKKYAYWFPYRIAVIDPHPDFMSGKGRIKEFQVDDPIPTMTIPLSGNDRIVFDFNAPYIKTFEEMLYGDEVNYSQLPLNFELYNPDDQQRILSRMVALTDATDLNTSPDTVAQIPTDEALSRLKLDR